MSWWLFLPLAYLAMGFDRICASELAWRGDSPGFLLLLWSILAVRASPRSMIQACLLGLLADLSTGGPLGLTPAVFVTVTFLSGRIRRAESSQPLSWLFWSWPLMLVSLGGIQACEWLLRSSTVSPQLLARHTLLTVTITFGWGAGLKLSYSVFRRLIRFRAESTPPELQAGSFFLSR